MSLSIVNTAWRGLGPLVAAALVGGLPTAIAAESLEPTADATASLPNPFEGWHTWMLDGDLKVWFKDLDGATKVRVSATLPVGGGKDPEGLEGLAHFLEHVMFTDDGALTESEVKAEVKERRGAYNATTWMERTDYWVEVPAPEWRFAMRWVRDRVFHGPIRDDVVDEQRKGVVLEKSLKPRNFVDRLRESVFTPEWARMPDFWEREFGLDVDHDQVIGTWESLQRITHDDLQTFHDRWYGPQNVTFAIIGDLDPGEVREWAEELFAGLERRGETATTREPARDPQRFRREVVFHTSGTSDYTTRYKLYDRTQRDYLMTLFLRYILEEHLNESLRIKRKASYHVKPSLATKSGHLYLQVFGRFDPDELEHARTVIDETFEDLRQASMPPERFSELQGRAVAGYMRGNQTPEKLHAWIRNTLYARDQFEGFPDVVDFMRQLSQAEVADWTREKLVEERRHDHLARIRPIPLLLEVVLVVAGLGAIFSLLRRWWTDSVDLTRLRYMRKIQYSISYLVLVGGTAALLLMLVLNGVVYGLSWVGLLVIQVDSYAFRISVVLLRIALVLAILLLLPTNMPAKLLLFEHEWRVKFLFYRSKGRRYDDIQEARECRLHEVLLAGRARGVIPLHWGMVRKGIYLRFGRRRALFFSTRDNREMLEQLERLAGRPLASRAEETPG